MHSASIDERNNCLNNMWVSVDRLLSRVRCLRSISSRRLDSMGSTALANSQKLSRMSSSPSKRLISKRASALSQVTPMRSKPTTISLMPMRVIVLSAKNA
eukprot:CAMPEP_0185579768 /NCGR_PEP_ID=MMETSP0434-20130131/15404_1 /TAXON_ID=626734 ORGANISM="Favella taraikaensis, Strain Fe Narragansett Bay" /NCGR_SAMPLE_ID=MMETSP0434 /ASSEMBLY_ACC=CAM_ASM_000379 /LENGTH=99 /DNA_ID=CAMNT_0028197865 /DNA_START=558 /DNA_END=857 /DNA_ORIENTATION=+